MSEVADDFIARLDAVQTRLDAQAHRDVAGGALTAPDEPTGEQWEVGQVWAHLAEFIPYWIAETAAILASHDAEPPMFGRTKKDPGRIAAIEQERRTDRAALWERVRGNIGALRSFIATVPDDGWLTMARHPTLGPMTVEEQVQEFLVGHLEEHADQLEELAAQSTR